MNEENSEGLAPTMSDERREFFRIEDTVQLRVVDCTHEQVSNTPCPNLFDHSGVKTLMQELKGIDYDNQQLLRGLVDDNRTLELYLKSINKKIDLVASHLCATINDNEHQHKQLVTLSESGMAFLHPECLRVNDYIGLELTLLPSFSSLYLYAQVMSCVECPGKYRIGIQFVELAEIDRQALAKQVMHCQLAQKRMNQD